MIWRAFKKLGRLLQLCICATTNSVQYAESSTPTAQWALVPAQILPMRSRHSQSHNNRSSCALCHPSGGRCRVALRSVLRGAAASVCRPAGAEQRLLCQSRSARGSHQPGPHPRPPPGSCLPLPPPLLPPPPPRPRDAPGGCRARRTAVSGGRPPRPLGVSADGVVGARALQTK